MFLLRGNEPFGLTVTLFAPRRFISASPWQCHHLWLGIHKSTCDGCQQYHQANDMKISGNSLSKLNVSHPSGIKLWLLPPWIKKQHTLHHLVWPNVVIILTIPNVPSTHDRSLTFKYSGKFDKALMLIQGYGNSQASVCVCVDQTWKSRECHCSPWDEGCTEYESVIIHLFSAIYLSLFFARVVILSLKFTTIGTFFYRMSHTCASSLIKRGLLLSQEGFFAFALPIWTARFCQFYLSAEWIHDLVVNVMSFTGQPAWNNGL